MSPFKSGDDPAAIEILLKNAAKSRDKGDFESCAEFAFDALGHMAADNARRKEAEAILFHAAKMDLYSIRCQYRLAQYCTNQGRYNEALAAFEKGIKLADSRGEQNPALLTDYAIMLTASLEVPDLDDEDKVWRVDIAEYYFAEALQCTDNHVRVYEGLVKLYVATRNHQSAAFYARKLQSSPDAPNPGLIPC